MKAVKYRFEHLFIYDYTRIQAHLEAMAAQGWLLEKVDFLWKYRRIQPQKLKFCVTYYADASLYDPQPTEGECTMEDFCAAGGWKLAARREQMQIYYTEQEDAIPMETDPITQVETVNRAMRKKQRPNNILMTCLVLYWIVFYTSQLHSDPAKFLSNSLNLAALASMVLLLPCLIRENLRYRTWYRRALAAAQQGEFVPSLGEDRLMLYVVRPLVVLLVTFALMQMGDGMAMLGLMLLLGVGVGILAEVIRRMLQKRGVSRSVNETLTAVGCGLLYIFLLVYLMLLVLDGSFHWGSHQPVGTYTVKNWTRPVYADWIPLRLENLAENLPGEMQYSTEVQGEESFLVSDKRYSQIPLTTEELPQPLYYRVVQVKVPALYGLCKNGLLREWQDKIVDGTPERVSHYEPIDPAPWGAQEAYRLYFGKSKWGDAYLICWEDTMVELEWSQVQQLTLQQMAVVEEKIQLR